MKYAIAILALAAIAASQTIRQLETKPIAILRQAHDITPEGSYSYQFDTENGIAHQEVGAPRAQGPDGLAVTAQGSYQYVDPEGNTIQVTYTADETGFHPMGAHLPQAPPTPDSVLRALEYIRTHPTQEEIARQNAQAKRGF